ncbi:MAG: hypothetical protein FP810_06455 [Desulfocapsa sp.]|jgi:hypothetical protein|nr:hypothetical protein [Desulfocapsa sp.]MBU3946432.1 hypothetical protein [Pseudomonadota bacterium]MCG2743385.1 hypothetical protein [Desulfobacteraceae bacterium]
MKMDGNIRVATETKYKELYNNMKSYGATEDFHALFFVCACLGYRKGKIKALPKRDDRFWSRTITPPEWACYYAMILEQNSFDYDKVADDKDVLASIEGYANAGMDILIEEFLGDFLLPSSKSSDPQLDPAFCKEIPKQFVHFLFDQSESEGLE